MGLAFIGWYSPSACTPHQLVLPISLYTGIELTITTLFLLYRCTLYQPSYEMHILCILVGNLLVDHFCLLPSSFSFSLSFPPSPSPRMPMDVYFMWTTSIVAPNGRDPHQLVWDQVLPSWIQTDGDDWP